MARRAARLSLLVLALMAALSASPSLPSADSAPRQSPAAGMATATTLSATASPEAVAYGRGKGITVAGSISVPDATLILSARNRDETEWAELAVTVAAENGNFAFTPQPAPTISTEYRVAYEGDGAHDAAAINLSVTVLPRVTLQAPATVWINPDATLGVNGTVEPDRAGQSVLIDLRQSDGEWTQVAATRLDAGSHFSIALSPQRFGTLVFRARTEGDQQYGPGRSPTRKIVVNRANAHRVPYRFARYIVTVVHEYRLYYYEHGKIVRSFRVALGRPGYRTPIGTYAIYHKRRPGGGALGSCVMFYRRAGGLAVHGTNQPALLSRFPRPFSHGCARMHNAEALWLFYRCPVGTPVRNLR